MLATIEGDTPIVLLWPFFRCALWPGEVTVVVMATQLGTACERPDLMMALVHVCVHLNAGTPQIVPHSSS